MGAPIRTQSECLAEVAEHRMHRHLFIWKREERIRRALEARGYENVKVTITRAIEDDLDELEEPCR